MDNMDSAHELESATHNFAETVTHESTDDTPDLEGIARGIAVTGANVPIWHASEFMPLRYTREADNDTMMNSNMHLYFALYRSGWFAKQVIAGDVDSEVLRAYTHAQSILGTPGR